MEPKKVTRWNQIYSLEWCYVCNRRIFPSVLPHRRNRLNLCLDPKECKMILNDINFVLFENPKENDEISIYDKNKEYLGKFSYKIEENKVVVINSDLDEKTKYSELFIKMKDFLKRPDIVFEEEEIDNRNLGEIIDDLPDFY